MLSTKSYGLTLLFSYSTNERNVIFMGSIYGNWGHRTKAGVGNLSSVMKDVVIVDLWLQKFSNMFQLTKQKPNMQAMVVVIFKVDRTILFLVTSGSLIFFTKVMTKSN